MIKTYTMPNCPMCEELKSFMMKSHITYEETNVEEDFRAYAKLTSLDIDQMPAVEINGKFYSGDIEELKNIVSM